MKLRTSFHPTALNIDVAPLVNVVLLLFIFFILTSSFVFQPGIKVDPPRGTGAGATSSRYIVALSAQEPMQIFFNDQLMTEQDLAKKFEAIARDQTHPIIILKADRQVSHGNVVTIMSMAAKVGLSILLATQPESPSSP